MTTLDIKPDTTKEMSKPDLTWEQRLAGWEQREAMWNQKIKQDDEKLLAYRAMQKDDLFMAINALARAGDDEVKAVYEAGIDHIISKVDRAVKIEHMAHFLEAYKDRLEKCNAQLKVKFYAESKIEARDEELAAAKAELAAFKEQLKAKDDLLKSKDEQLKLSMALVASKDELAKAKQAPKGQPLACITNA